MDFPVFNTFVHQLIELAIQEDLSHGDVTSQATIPPDSQSAGIIRAKQDCVIAGQPIAELVFQRIDPTLKYHSLLVDGRNARPGDHIGSIQGNTRSILMAERTVLNFLQRLSGIATLTAATMKLISGLACKLIDTRKTTPGWRLLEKYAVRLGGGANHRLNLGDGILIKDNHILAAGGIEAAIEAARNSAHHLLKIEIEVSTEDEAMRAVSAGAEILLLDNMPSAKVRRIAKAYSGSVILEASGGITHETLRRYAEAGVDYISMGALTHSATAVDISLDLENERS